MPDQPYYKSVSFLTSSTAIVFVIVAVGAVIFAFYFRNENLILKLVDMVVPAYLLSKGIGLGQPKARNGEEKPPAP